MLLSMMLLTSTSQGAAYYFSDIGVRAYSRGGAFVAGADDLTAMYYNPAALTRMRGFTTTLSLAGVGQDITFDRADYPGEGPNVLDEQGRPTFDENNDPILADLNHEPVENGAPAYVIPHFGVSGNFGLPNTTFALGFYPPYAPDVAYPKDGPQRYSLVDTLVIQTFTGVSVGHEIADWISIGGGVSWNALIVEQELTAYVASEAIENEDPQFDVFFGVRAEDFYSITWNAGVLIEPPSEKWAIGGMYQPPIKFDAKGNLYSDFTGGYYEDLLVDAKPDDKDITLDVTMPPILRTGALVRPTSRMEIEFAYVWQGWSNLESLTVRNLNLPIQQTTADEPTVITDNIVLPTGFVDAHSFRLGGQYDLREIATVRLGGNYETSAVKPENLAPNMVDTNKIGYGIGGSYHFDFGLSLDVGWSQVFYEDVTVTDSEVSQIGVDPFTGDIYDGRVIADGSYSSRLKLLGGGFTYNFQPKN